MVDYSNFALGITSTDITKEASDMVLADDNFATIVNAVRGDRIVNDNIHKFIRFHGALNFTELILISDEFKEKTIQEKRRKLIIYKIRKRERRLKFNSNKMIL